MSVYGNVDECAERRVTPEACASIIFAGYCKGWSLRGYGARCAHSLHPPLFGGRPRRRHEWLCFIAVAA